MTLYEVTENIKALKALLTEEGGKLVNEAAEAAIDEWLREIQGDLEAKLDAYYSLIRERQSRIRQREAEIARLQELVEPDTNLVKRPKARLQFFLQQIGKEKVETPRF